MDDADRALVERLRNGPYTIGKSTGDIVELRQAASRIEAMGDEIEALRKGVEITGEMLQAGNRAWLDGGNERQIFEAMMAHVLLKGTPNGQG